MFFGVFEGILADRFYKSPCSLDSFLKASWFWRNGHQWILIWKSREHFGSIRVKSEKLVFWPFEEDLRFYRGLRLRTFYLRPRDLKLRPRPRYGHWLFWIWSSDESLRVFTMVISWLGFSQIESLAIVIFEQCLTCDEYFREERLRGA